MAPENAAWSSYYRSVLQPLNNWYFVDIGLKSEKIIVRNYNLQKASTQLQMPLSWVYGIMWQGEDIKRVVGSATVTQQILIMMMLSII